MYHITQNVCSAIRVNFSPKCQERRISLNIFQQLFKSYILLALEKISQAKQFPATVYRYFLSKSGLDKALESQSGSPAITKTQGTASRHKKSLLYKRAPAEDGLLSELKISTRCFPKSPCFMSRVWKDLLYPCQFGGLMRLFQTS